MAASKILYIPRPTFYLFVCSLVTTTRTILNVDMAATTLPFRYRFVYFNTRGAGELCRLTLAVAVGGGSGSSNWDDIRYPLSLAETGFSYGEEYKRDAATGAFDGNMGKLPILQVVDAKNPTRALANIGQSHAICRFVALQHGLMGTSLIEHAKVDSLYESCRDIRTAFYRAKRNKAKSEWFESDLNRQCRLLERALAATATAPKPSSSSSHDNSPWCLGGTDPTLADIAIYHLLGTPNPDPVSGIVPSFMDGESDRIQTAYEKDCPRIRNAVRAMAENDQIIEWESKRPDTFT